ncbi:MAG: alpha/beta hydrolase [Lewinella sp.]|nr:alpha/beta hydrolase [Lewinella sp.]
MKEKQILLNEGDRTINYLQQGTGDICLLFLHGWCINSAYWANQLSYFSTQFSVYAPDLPGFGKSIAHRDSWTIKAFANDIIDFIHALELKNVVVIAHSMAGEIMLEMALAGRIDLVGLIGVDNFKFVDVEFTPDQLEQFQAFLPLLQSDFRSHAPVYAENMLFHPGTPGEIQKRVKSDFSAADPQVGYGSFVNLMQYATNVPSKLELLSNKLHLVNTSFPPTNVQGLATRCRYGYELRTIEACGHYPMLEKPVEFNRLLQSTLSEIMVEAPV